MLHILIDLDGVMADWTEGIRHDMRHIQLRALLSVLIDETKWHLGGGTNTILQSSIHVAQARPGFYRNLKPITGALEAIEWLTDNGHKVTFVSTPDERNPTCASDKIAWLEEHLGEGWSKSLILTHDKTLVDGDILIDDKPVITGYRTPTWKHVIFGQPYNVEATGYRVEGWDDLFEKFHGGDMFQSLLDVPLEDHIEESKNGEILQPESEALTAEFRSLTDLEGTVAIDHRQIGHSYTSGPLGDALRGSEVRSVSSTGGEKGVKLARFDLIPVDALLQLAEHYGRGAAKYDDNQWRKGYEWSKSYAAMMRHVTQFWEGEDYDSETGSHHIAAAAWHCFTLMTFVKDFPQFDDRFKGE